VVVTVKLETCPIWNVTALGLVIWGAVPEGSVEVMVIEMSAEELLVPAAKF